jgi:sorbitol-specific phosphotransferase system component IIBC
VLDLQNELAGQYTVARTNIIVAESMIRAAADQPKEQAKKTIAAAMSIIEDTEESLIGRVSAIGFNVREDIRKLFNAARQTAEAIIKLPSTIGSGFGLSFGIMALGGLGLLGLALVVGRKT